MRVTCIAMYDPRAVSAFGVRLYGLFQALDQEVDELRYLPCPPCDSLWIHMKKRIHNRMGCHYFPERDAHCLKCAGKILSRQLIRQAPDIVFSPMSPGSQPVAYLQCRTPVVIWTDVTLAGALDFYPGLERGLMCRESLRDGLANERAALQRADLIAYSSDWAAEYAIRHYGLDARRVAVIPFGAGMRNGLTGWAVQRNIEKRMRSDCRLLFVGREWERKGGPVAVHIARQLNRAGIRARLTIAGCEPPIQDPLPSYVRSAGFINRATPEGRARYDTLMDESHFLLLPTRADCSPMVIPEANARGVPVLSTRVGGIPTAIRNHVNGHLFDLSAGAGAYVSYIRQCYGRGEAYRRLAWSSFEEYRNRLNWQVSCTRLATLMKGLLANDALAGRSAA